MLGYLYILCALAAGITKGWCGKKTSGTVTTMRGTLLFSAVRMLICIPIGLLTVVRAGCVPMLAADGLTLLISAVSGISTAMFVVMWIGCVRWGAYMMVDVFVTLGIAIPTVLSAVCFGETVGANHIAGFVLLLFAAYMMCTYNSTLRGGFRLTARQLCLLILCGASNGVTQFSQKWLSHSGNTDNAVFQFYTYIFAAAVLLLCTLFSKREPGGDDGQKKPPIAKLGFYVVIMSACLFLHSFFSTAAAGYLPSAVLYPLMQGSALVLSMLMSAVCFGERINTRCVVGIAAAFAAMLCINLF